MKWSIVTDSGCDLRKMPPSESVRYAQAPLYILINGISFEDDEKLDTKMLVNAMHGFRGASSSACPSPQSWMNAFGDEENVIAMSISGGMSGSFGSLQVARETALEERPECKILVIDSLSTSSVMTLVAQKARVLIEQGLDFDAVSEQLIAYHKRLKLLFTLKSLDNLAKNGRVSRTVAAIAGVLNIQIVGAASEKGTFELMHKCRGTGKAYRMLIEEMGHMGADKGRAIIAHCHNEQGAKELRAMIESAFPGLSVDIMPTSGLCSYYAEEGGLLVGFETVK